MKSWLDAPQSYWDATPEQRARVCNGVGPASWPPERRTLLRQASDELLGINFDEPAGIHDWEYEFGKTQREKKIADDRFGRNCRETVYRAVSWWGLLRHPRKELEKFAARMAVANALERIVENFGDGPYWVGKQRPDR